MRLKKSKQNKEDSIRFKTTEAEKNKIQQKANIYTDGNLSEYVRYAALNFVPSKSDMEKEKK